MKPARGENIVGDGHGVGGVAERALRERVRVRLVREARDVEAQAVGERQVVAHAPLVARVEAELEHREVGRLQRVRRVRVAVVVRTGDSGGEVVDAREAIVAVRVLDEEVPELEELVVRAERERMRSAQQGEVVGQLDDVLIELVLVRRVLRAELHVGAVREVDLEGGKGRLRTPSTAVVALALVGDAQFVEHRTQRRVQLTDGRIRRVLDFVEVVRHVVGELRLTAVVSQAVHVVVAHRQARAGPKVEVGADKHLVVVVPPAELADGRRGRTRTCSSRCR